MNQADCATTLPIAQQQQSATPFHFYHCSPTVPFPSQGQAAAMVFTPFILFVVYVLLNRARR